MKSTFMCARWVKHSLLLVLSLGYFAQSAVAQPAPDQEQLALQVEQFLVERASDLGGQAEVFVSPVTKVPACDQFDVYLPTGRKLSSKTTVAVRCLGYGSSAPLYVRADVKVIGTYFVPAQTIQAGQAISANLLESVEGDLMRLPQGVLRDSTELVGRIAVQRLQSGKPVRASATRSANSVSRGDVVRIEARSPGLTITSQGEALGSAEPGSSVQVKTEHGRIIQAMVEESGVVTFSP